MTHDLVIRDLDGSEASFAEFKGEVLFVNFWASWCRPCIVEMPTIEVLRRRMEGEDVTFLLISTDEQASDVSAFLDRHGARNWPVYFRTWKFGDSPFKRIGIPASFVVDRKGEIVYRHVGAANWDSESIAGFLAGLAGE